MRKSQVNEGGTESGSIMVNLKIDDFQKKLDIPKAEHEVLEFWDETKAFEESVKKRPEEKRYVFYDGPPFATGLPHYGHILASTIKDVIPRYWTMKGYRVERVWGWDCHGIPIENMIEKELDLKGGKKGIEELGIATFNDACRSAILRFDKEWEKVIRRIGRWVDFKNSYKTMDKTYMESVWWAFKTLNDKGLIYEGRRVILYCPRCATPLSNFEIAMDNSYKDVEDNSVYVMFPLKDRQHEYFVAWTTTPWTLVGNVALAVDPKASYVKVAAGDAKLWMAEKRAAAVLKEDDWEVKVLEKAKGESLLKLEYEPLFSYMPVEGKKAHYVAPADFVSLEEGTGIVHTAAIYGEDDYRLAQKIDLPCVPTLDDQGRFLEFVTPLSGIFYKKAEDWIIQDLEKRDLMFRAETYIHSYPFCYRCETPLFYNAVPAWFINVQQLKDTLVTQNEHINWYPDHLKHGRFGKGLETAPDWNISRSRFWGTPMPVWIGEKTGMNRVIGSLEELKTWAVDPSRVDTLTDLHREFVDDLEVWVDNNKTEKGKRIPEVFDCWVESGSMPYAAIHYPFEHKDQFEKSHPAQFIAEYIAQTRAWFYTLHVMSVGLFGKHTFENAVTTGTILAEDGTKMSKSKKNFPDPSKLFETYGVDALRFYLMSSVVMKGENLNFSEKDVREVYQKLISILWNVFAFYKLYTKDAKPPDSVKPEHVLDLWIVSRSHSLIRDLTISMDTYDTVKGCRLLQDFVTDISTWYLRRSRERLRTDKGAQSVFGWVLITLTRLLAPIVPFLSERMYQNMLNGSSVHLQSWPVFDETLINTTLETDMVFVREIVERLLSERKGANIPVRQPLASATVTNLGRDLSSELLTLIAQEINVGAVNITRGKDAWGVSLDTRVTPELTAQGKARELTRAIQVLRKEKACKIDQRVRVQVPEEFRSLPDALLERVKKDTLTSELVWGESLAILTG